MIVGVDVGGTFTDIILVDEESGRVQVGKVPSMPQNEGQAVLNGLEGLRTEAPAVRRLVHGTTVGTNAIIQRKGSKIALLTTTGFRDLVEIGRTKRMIPALFNPTFVRPKPVVPRSLRFEVRERVLYDGSVHIPLQEEEMDPLCTLLQEHQIEALAICFLHSYANGQHEDRAAELISRRLPKLPISRSSQVVPEYREFERFSTTVLNAYIQPLMQAYLRGLDRSLAQSGFHTGILTIASSGGVMTLDTAIRLPVQSILSGPAGGVIQSIFVAQQLGTEDIITYDMGGTSTDVCLVRGLSPVISTDNVVSGFPLKVPQIDINSVGAGGGSIAWVDVDGSLQVGPRSAAADPGPACYGRGGTEPTVTDANLVLNRLSARQPLGGSIGLVAELAMKALANLAQGLGGIDVHRLAEGIIRIAVARMNGVIREISLQRGHDPREFVLMAFGGAGPMHATQVAEELGIKKVLVPRHPGNVSALGLASCDLKHDYVRTRLTPGSRLTREDIASGFAELNDRARAELAAEGFGPENMHFYPSLDMRYRGQAFEINIPVSKDGPDPQGITRDFHQRHLDIYGHSNEGGEVEVVNFRLAAYGIVPKPQLAAHESPAQGIKEAELERRQVYFHGQFVECPVLQRELLPVGAAIPGPAIVEEFGATTVLFPSWTATVDGVGNLTLEWQE